MTSIKVHKVNCRRHKEDFRIIMSGVDDVGAAALALATNGAQAYTQFIEARDNYKLMVTEIFNNYRYVVIDDETE